jgi:hypothetical protein
LIVALAMGAGGCGGSHAGGQPFHRWIAFDAQRRTVRLALIPAYNDVYGGFNFNGYGKGQVLVQVPRGWRVVVRCSNERAGGPHSCAIVKGTEASAPAFPGAASPAPLSGLPAGGSATFTFVANRLGVYRIASLVRSDEQAGMWDVVAVTASRRPSVTLLRRSTG